MNMFEENAQWRKPLVVPPAPFSEYTDTPNIDAQVSNAFGEAPQLNANAPIAPMAVVQPEPTREEKFKARMEENMRLGFNPLSALIDSGTPPVDEKRQQRLKFAAGLNALGQGLSTAYGGYIGSKGGPILAQENTFTPLALKEYNDRINADNEAKYRNAMSKAAIGKDVFQQTSRQLEMEELQKERALAQKAQNEYMAAREDKKMKQDNDHFDATLQLNKDQHKEALAMSQAQLAEQISGRKATLGYQYYAANLNDKLYRDGLKGGDKGSNLADKFSPSSTVPVQMPDGSIIYIDGVKAWEILGKVADRTSKDKYGNATDVKNPLITRMGNNDFTTGEASALISTYGMDLLGVQPAKSVDPLGIGDFNTPAPMAQPVVAQPGKQSTGDIDLSRYPGAKKGFGATAPKK